MFVRNSLISHLGESAKGKGVCAAYLQIHFEGRQQESASPRMLLHAARPSRWPAHFTLAIVEEGDNVRIALADNEELDVQHFGQSRDRNLRRIGRTKQRKVR